MNDITRTSNSQVSQAPEPSSYVVEGETYRKLIAERDAYRTVANDLARQLRERRPADTNVPSERTANEPSSAPWRVVCAKCGKPPRVDLGHDLRFPNDLTQMAYRAQCSGDCLEPTFSRRTPDAALEAWNRIQIANGAPFPRAAQPPAPAPFHLTEHQVEHLLDILDGSPSPISFREYAEDRKCSDSDETMPRGLYMWFTEYPEEGQMLLKAYSPDVEAMAAEMFAPSAPTKEGGQ